MIQQILLSITFVNGPLYLLTRTKIFDKHLCLPFGLLDNPYEENSLIKTDILPLNDNYFPEIVNFIKTLNK